MTYRALINSNFHLIRSKTLPMNDFELTIPNLYFLRYAEQLSNDDEVLIQKNFELSPEKVVNVSDISMIGKNNSKFLVFINTIRHLC